MRPGTGIKTEEVFAYDNSGRPISVSRLSSMTRYVYNQVGYITKKIISGGTNTLEYTYQHDARRNIVKETDPYGQITEYDNKKNPFYYIHSNPGTLTPSTMSRNNIVKGKGSSNFVRVFQYNRDGFPIQVVEDNGQTYVYHYH